MRPVKSQMAGAAGPRPGPWTTRHDGPSIPGSHRSGRRRRYDGPADGWMDRDPLDPGPLGGESPQPRPREGEGEGISPLLTHLVTSHATIKSHGGQASALVTSITSDDDSLLPPRERDVPSRAHDSLDWGREHLRLTRTSARTHTVSSRGDGLDCQDEDGIDRRMAAARSSQPWRPSMRYEWSVQYSYEYFYLDVPLALYLAPDWRRPLLPLRFV